MFTEMASPGQGHPKAYVRSLLRREVQVQLSLLVFGGAADARRTDTEMGTPTSQGTSPVTSRPRTPISQNRNSNVAPDSAGGCQTENSDFPRSELRCPKGLRGWGLDRELRFSKIGTPVSQGASRVVDRRVTVSMAAGGGVRTCQRLNGRGLRTDGTKISFWPKLLRFWMRYDNGGHGWYSDAGRFPGIGC